jgi:hypothetical protein
MDDGVIRICICYISRYFRKQNLYNKINITILDYQVKVKLSTAR